VIKLTDRPEFSSSLSSHTYVTLGNALTQGASAIVGSLVALTVLFAVAFGYFVVKPSAQASPAAA